MTDEVNHPPHYGGEDNPYEAIKVVEAWSLDFHLCNVIKYIYRASKKREALADLKKARGIWTVRSQTSRKRRTDNVMAFRGDSLQRRCYHFCIGGVRGGRCCPHRS